PTVRPGGLARSGKKKRAPEVPALVSRVIGLSLWQHVTHAGKAHHQVSILRRAESNEPRCTRQVRGLSDQHHGAVLWVLPEGLCPLEGGLLDGAIGAVGRVDPAKANNGFYDQGRSNVREGVTLEVEPAIV